MKHWFGNIGVYLIPQCFYLYSPSEKINPYENIKSYDGKEQWIMKQKGRTDINRYLI